MKLMHYTAPGMKPRNGWSIVWCGKMARPSRMTERPEEATCEVCRAVRGLDQIRVPRSSKNILERFLTF